MMTNTDYRGKIEEGRQEIELDDSNARLSRTKRKETKRKSPWMTVMLVIFILIPLTVLIYMHFIYKPELPVETAEQQSHVIRVEKNDLPKAVADEDEEDDAAEEEKQEAEERAAKEAAAAKAAQEAVQAKAAQEKVAQEKAAQEKAVRERAAEEKAAQEKAAREKAAAEQVQKPKRTHTVQSNETLYRIAMNYYKDPNAVEKIKQANGLRSNEISVGQTLVLP